MTEPTFLDYMGVELVQCVASDASVVNAARVSTLGDMSKWDDDESEGLINYLMRNRHGTPFEHNHFVFRVHAPIFVFREFHRHRIGWSYNEESGRYTQLKPVFYIPSPTRNMVQVGKVGEYEFNSGPIEMVGEVRAYHRAVSRLAYEYYEKMLEMGVAKEVARMALPLNIYSTMYATANARSIMAFLSLRTGREGAAYPSKPMREIEMVAEQIEVVFKAQMPITYEAFDKHGRVCP